MATYPVVNQQTGEQKEVKMSVTKWTQWCEDNPGWIRDWSDPSTMPGTGEVGEWRDKLVNKNPGWGEVLQKADKSGGIGSRLAKRGINTTQSALSEPD